MPYRSRSRKRSNARDAHGRRIRPGDKLLVLVPPTLSCPFIEGDEVVCASVITGGLFGPREQFVRLAPPHDGWSNGWNGNRFAIIREISG